MSLAEGAAPARLDAKAFGFRNRAVLVGASGLFLLPSAVFALALRPLPAIAVVSGCLGAFALLVAGGRRAQGDVLAEPVDAPRLLLAVGVAAGLLLLGGETHLFFATSDWQIRDAVLADLARYGSPVSYAVDGATYLLRAPLGMYAVPGAVGRAFGLSVAHAALLAQNALLLGAIFYLLMRLGRGWPHLMLMVLFAGMPVLGILLFGPTDPAALRGYWRFSLDAWHPSFQYSSAMVQFFWVPNHALPGWWLALLILLQRRAGLDAATLGVSVAALSFWSPLAVLPALPWLAWQGCAAWRTTLRAPRTWLGLAAAACFAPLPLYMVAASGSIAHGSSVGLPNFAAWYTVFILIQLPALGLLAVCWRRVPRELWAPLVVSGVVLLGLPFFSFGPSNDLVMRGSTAPLAVVAYAFGLVLLEATRARATVAAAAGWIIAASALPSAALEVCRALTVPRWRVSDCTLMQAARRLDATRLPTNYVAPVAAVSPRIIDAGSATAAPAAPRICWPDLPPER